MRLSACDCTLRITKPSVHHSRRLSSFLSQPSAIMPYRTYANYAMHILNDDHPEGVKAGVRHERGLKSVDEIHICGIAVTLRYQLLAHEVACEVRELSRKGERRASERM